MGLVVTTNSSTLVNKGLEVIEAHLLFDVPYDRIEVTVHPQSIVHSMVEFVDGSTIAQASPPDMRLPISLGLDWPNRVAGRRRSARLDDGARAGRSSRSTTTRSRRSRWPSGSAWPEAPTPPCSTRRTSRPSPRSTPARSATSTSSTPSSASSTRTTRSASCTRETLALAERWARAEADRLIAAH